MTDMSRFKGRSDDVSEVNNYPKILNNIKYFYSVIKMNLVNDYVNVLCTLYAIQCLQPVNRTLDSSRLLFFYLIYEIRLDAMFHFIHLI